MATLQLDLLPGAFQAHKSVSSLYQALTFPGAQPWAAERKQSQCSNFSNFIPSILSSLKWDRKCAAHSSTALPSPCGTGIFSPLGIRAVPCSYCHHQGIAQWDKANGRGAKPSNPCNLLFRCNFPRWFHKALRLKEWGPWNIYQYCTR